MIKFQKYFFPLLIPIVWLIILFFDPGTREKNNFDAHIDYWGTYSFRYK
ncbi:hypothetical protein ACQUED_08475 [Lactococcus lactis]|uniref:Uncharacterized protein n=1 Tax=Lactococcus lactis subsp. lactis TaxID=1360 RepID=A0AAC9R6Q7_LACLL|nr:hypothetical protein [Lactococcus lactis]ARE14292.1 hypothetical protein LLUC11_1967 [Lactococcus lactis subsp. lactis]ARE16709.1 hypothetical protein LLUC08_1973 [Lactococcus lactis subsp. lactis]